MDDTQVEKTIIERAQEFFKNEIIPAHMLALDRASKLSEYNVLPFLFKYLANFLEGNSDSYSIAKSLLYPRILGTSITTSFGMRAQKMISTIFKGFGSAVPGIDIEFTDGIDGRRKYCQLKSGPLTINRDDIVTIVNHFKGIKNLARVNNLDVRATDLIVGVLYGDYNGLNQFYHEIDKSYPVYAGDVFWYHLTGDKTFYNQLIEAIGVVVLEVNAKEKVEKAIRKLAEEIEHTGVS